MVYKFLVSLSAELDIAENYVWYESKRLGLGEDFFHELSAHFKLIEGSSEANPTIPLNDCFPARAERDSLAK